MKSANRSSHLGNRARYVLLGRLPLINGSNVLCLADYAMLYSISIYEKEFDHQPQLLSLFSRCKKVRASFAIIWQVLTKYRTQTQTVQK